MSLLASFRPGLDGLPPHQLKTSRIKPSSPFPDQRPSVAPARLCSPANVIFTGRSLSGAPSPTREAIGERRCHEARDWATKASASRSKMHNINRLAFYGRNPFRGAVWRRCETRFGGRSVALRARIGRSSETAMGDGFASFSALAAIA